MRVDDAVTYDVSQGHDVTYVGMTADGSKVYFTSAEQLTREDHDASVDLYMWSEEATTKATRSPWSRRGTTPATPANRATATPASQSRPSSSTKTAASSPTPSSPTASSTGGAGRQLPLRQLDRRRKRRHLLLLPGAARRLARDPEPGEPLRLPQWAGRSTSPPSAAGTVLHRKPGARLHRQRLLSDPDRADAGLPGRQPHGLPHRQPGHPVRQRRPPRDVHSTTPRPATDRLRLLHPQRRTADLRRRRPARTASS